MGLSFALTKEGEIAQTMTSKHLAKRLTALLLALSMSGSLLPSSVLAAELTPQVSESTTDGTLEDTLEDTLERTEPSTEPADTEQGEEVADTSEQVEDETEPSEATEPVEQVESVEQTEQSEQIEQTEQAQEEEGLTDESTNEPLEEVAEQEQPPAEWKVVIEPQEITELIDESWEDGYFQEAVIDTKKNRVTVDGEKTSLKNAFGTDAVKANLFDSPETVAEYFEATAYETETQSNGKVTVTAPYQSKRIIVEAESLEGDYGAATVLEYREYHEYILQFDTAEQTSEAYEQLNDIYGENCYIDTILSAEDTLLETDTSDEYTPYSWGSRYMGMSGLKNMPEMTEQAPVTVAIIDTGIDTSSGFFEGRPISDKSCAFVEESNGVADVTGHGTHVVGIVMDCTPSNVELMVLRVYNSAGKTTTLAVNNALQYALNNGADVINMSLGENTTLKRTYLDSSLSAAKQAGVVVCVAAGNFSTDVANVYPANSPDTVTVSGIANTGAFGSYSCYGDEIDFCGAGSSVTSANAPTVSGSDAKTTIKTGTSMASPHIAAVFAYLRMSNPAASVSELYDIAKDYCVDLGEKGKDDYFGWGCPNVEGLFSEDCIHEWKLEVVEPTCMEKGYTVRTCEKCGLSYRSYETESVLHQWQSIDSETMRCAICGTEARSKFDECLTWNIDKAGTLTIAGAGEVQTAPWLAYYTPKQIKGLVLKNGVTAVKAGVFSGYTSLNTVNFGDSLQTVGEMAFHGCTSLKTVAIPASLTSIGAGAFSACTSLTGFSLAKENKSFYLGNSNAALYQLKGTTPVKLVCFAAGYTVNGSKFRYYIPSTVTEIADYALEGSFGLSTLVVAPDVTRLGDSALKNCSGLTAVYFQCNAPTIADNAFDGSKAKVYVSDGAEGWEESYQGAFGGTLDWSYYTGDVSDWDASIAFDNYLFTGEPCEPTVTMTSGDLSYSSVNLTAFKKCFLLTYQDNTQPISNHGAQVVIKGTGIYYGSQTLTFSIGDITPMTLTLSNDSVTYDGTEQTPAVTVVTNATSAGFPETLTEGTDYTVAYADNLYTGTATVTVTGIGNYTGTLQKTFTIVCNETPSITARTAEQNGVKLQWKGVTGGKYYRVLRKTANETNWKQLKVVKGNTYTDTKVTSGVKYTYTVACCTPEGTDISEYHTTGWSVTYLSAASLSSAVNASAGIQVKWKKVTGATGYYVYRKSSSGWKKIATTSQLTYTDTKATTSGTLYTYTVRAYCKDAVGGYVTAGIKCYAVTKPAIYSLKSKKSAQLSVGWTAQKKVTGYQVQCSTKSSFASGATVTKSSLKTMLDVSKLNKGKIYYVRVRAYKKVSGKTYYSAWSTVKKIKVKA